MDNLVARIIEHVSHKSFSVYASKPIKSNLISGKSLRVSFELVRLGEHFFSFENLVNMRANKSARGINTNAYIHNSFS